MPELPDVEVFRRYLNHTSLHQRIAATDIFSAEVLDGVSPADLERSVVGSTIEGTSRHGKYLFAELSDGRELVLHFGMTGFPAYYKNDGSRPGHVRFEIHFENSYHLAYDNQRLLGRVFLVQDHDQFVTDRGLGPDAAEVSRSDLSSILARGRGAVKTTLMNQDMISGLGNVYSDEVLFQARIHPGHPTDALSEGDVQSIFDALKRVINEAIDAKAEPRSMPSDFLLPQRHEGGRCPDCGGRVRKATFSGRSAYMCPVCQEGTEDPDDS